MRNGVPGAKITVSGQGIAFEPAAVRASRNRETANEPINIAFLGRLDPTKGVHLLIQALNTDQKLAVRLDLYGIAQGESGEAYLQYLKDLTADDPRVHFLAPMHAGDVVNRLREYDALAVPSQWLETGPMVVLESFAAGVPVIGSDLGGIAELVRNGVDGLVIPPTVEGWAQTLMAICDDRGLLQKLRSGVREPRTIKVVAQELDQIYLPLLHSHASASR